MLKTGKNWKKKLGVISSLLLVLFWSAPAAAELKLFPMWNLRTCDADRLACYTFEQTKQILTIDLNLQLKLKSMEVIERESIDLKAALEKHKQAAAADKQIIDRLNLRLTEKDVKLSQTTNDLVRAQSHGIFQNLPWIITGTALASVAAFVGGWYVGSR